MMTMFGVVVSGRLPQVDFENVDHNKFLITIPEAGSINHVVVFMTGSAAFPPGMGASVYFSWPDPNMPPSWQYLGILSNDKPSAIYKITKLKGFGDSQRNSFDYIQSIVSHVAQIGISIEPLNILAQLTPVVKNGLTDTNDFKTFALKTAENLFNYITSFSATLPGTSEQYVPLTTVKNWYESYLRKLDMNPTFWKN